MGDWRFLESHPLADIFPMLDEEGLSALADGMVRDGFDPAHPIVLHEGRVLDGRNRLSAALAVRVFGGRLEPVFVEYAGDDPLGFVVRSNLHRRHLDAGQRAMIAADLLPRFEEEARRRMLSGQRITPDPEATLPQGRGPQARDAAGALFGVGGRSVAKAKKLKTAAPDLAEQVRAGKKPLEKANSELKKRERPRPNVAAAVPEGRYSVVYADPPWLYDHCAVDDWANENHYPTLSPEGIGALSVDGRRITEAFADDCVLFLWATSPKLPEAIGVVRAWGFTYKTSMVWVKHTSGAGMGYWTRVDHELLLIATRGEVSPPAVEHRFSSVLQAPTGRHSAKPTEMYERIETMTPGAVRLELFARGPVRPGWTAWGNETDG